MFLVVHTVNINAPLLVNTDHVMQIAPAQKGTTLTLASGELVIREPFQDIVAALVARPGLVEVPRPR